MADVVQLPDGRSAADVKLLRSMARSARQKAAGFERSASELEVLATELEQLLSEIVPI